MTHNKTSNESTTFTIINFSGTDLQVKKMFVLAANSLAVKTPGFRGERALEDLVDPRGFSAGRARPVARDVLALRILLYFQCALIAFS